MQLQGVIKQVLPMRSGVSKQGTQWRSASYVLEYEQQGAQFPLHCAFEVLGDRIDEFQLKQGDYVTVSLSVDAHEWQGRWFNSIKAYGCVKSPASQVQPQDATHSAPTMGTETPQAEDMPF